MTSDIVLSDCGECTSNTIEFVYAPKVSKKPLYEQTGCPLSVGNVLLLAPRDIDGMSTLSKNEMAMERLYGYGYQDGAKLERFLSDN